MGEYLRANTLRRRRIIKDCKYQKPYLFTRYGDAKKAILEYISSDDNNPEILDEAINDLEDKDVQSDFQEQDRDLSIEVLENFLDFDVPELFQYKVQIKGISNPLMKVNYVDISVKPDVLIRDASTQNLLGGIKVHISKTNILDEDSAKYVATVLYKYLNNHYEEENKEVSNDTCYLIDAFGQYF